MKSKKFSYNVSKPLIVENIKRFWIGSTLAFTGYFIVCIVPLIFADKTSLSSFVESLLSGGYSPMWGLVTAIPVCAALLIYRYMQQQSSTAIVHALPFSRKQLFHSNYISGAILCLVPIIITGIILMLISITTGPVIKTEFSTEVGFVMTNVFSITLILKWILKYCILTMAVFTISVFCAILTGSMLIQFVLSVGAIFIVPGAMYLSNSMLQKLLFGYSTLDWIGDFYIYTSPAISACNSKWRFVIVQALITIVLYIISYYLYKRRNLEKATESLVFKVAKPVIKYLFTFMGMCTGALFLDSFNYDGGLLFFLIGAFGGALITYVAVDMVIRKNVRIKGFVKGFGIYLIAAVAVFGLISTDLIGYESNIPNQDELKGAAVTGIVFEESYDSASGSGYVNNPEIIEEVRALHDDIIGAKDELFENSFKNLFKKNSNTDVYETSVLITYVKKDGTKIKREYTLPDRWYKQNAHIQKIVESEQYKENIYSILKWDLDKTDIHSVSALTYGEAEYFGKYNQSFSSEQIPQILNALISDIKNLKFNEMNGVGSNLRCLFTFEIMTDNPDKIDSKLNREYYKKYGCYYDEDEKYYDFIVNQYYTNTLNLLKEWGMYQQLVVSPEDVSYISIKKQNYSDDDNYYIEDSSESEDSVEAIVITDTALINEIFNTSAEDTSEFTYEGNCYYEIFMYPNSDSQNSDACMYRYYDGGKLPENLMDYVK